MAPLGLGISLFTDAITGSAPAAAIEDYFWELASAGNLTPLASGTVTDFHDVWDLDGTDYTPRATGAIRDEGYWDMPDDTSIQPLDV